MFGWRGQQSPYVVLVGDVGVGKSTVVEKLTGATGRASNSHTSATRTAEAFHSTDGALLVCDTPGQNSVEDKLEHNVWVAHAFNHAPVSKLIVVTKADEKSDCVVDHVRKYAERLADLPDDLVAVLVTHMDRSRAWNEADMTALMEQELGIEQVIFSSRDTTFETLRSNILRICGQPHDITVDSETFMQLFKFHNSNRKILRATNRELAIFRGYKQEFDLVKQGGLSQRNIQDLCFEFQAWMEEQIYAAQKRVSDELNFKFDGDNAANEAGHIANMTNQMKNILYSVKMETVGYQNQHGVNNLRRCPHCGEVWAKFEGCDGGTTCGSIPSPLDGFNGAMATFVFTIQMPEYRLRITRGLDRRLAYARRAPNQKGAGCGRQITWSSMQPVALDPNHFGQESDQVVTVDGVTVFAPTAERFKGRLDGMLGKRRVVRVHQ